MADDEEGQDPGQNGTTPEEASDKALQELLHRAQIEGLRKLEETGSFIEALKTHGTALGETQVDEYIDPETGHRMIRIVTHVGGKSPLEDSDGKNQSEGG